MHTPREVVRRAYAALNDRELEAFIDCYTDDCVCVWPAGITLHGRAELRAHSERLLSAYSDSRLTVESERAEGETVICQVLREATHSGELVLATGERIPATGRRIRVPGVEINSLHDGRIARSWTYFDRHELLGQLGVTGAQTGAAELARRFVAAFNNHDEPALRALNGPDVILSTPGDLVLRGREAATDYATAWLDAFPDARITVANQLLDGPYVVQLFTFEGTHRSALRLPVGSIPATNRELRGRGIQVFRVAQGMAVEAHLYYDQLQVLSQLGLMPALTAAN